MTKTNETETLIGLGIISLVLSLAVGTMFQVVVFTLGLAFLMLQKYTKM